MRTASRSATGCMKSATVEPITILLWPYEFCPLWQPLAGGSLIGAAIIMARDTVL